jgi:hypothetical protein
MTKLHAAISYFLTAGVFLLVMVVMLCADDLQPSGTHLRFRIDNRLIVEDAIIKSVTIFYDGRVYDFIGDHGQITIYDKDAGTLTLLDPSCRLKAVVTTETLADDFERRKETFRTGNSPLQNYLAEPYFEETAYESESGLMHFRSPWVEYRFETVTLNDPVVSQTYYDYCRQLTLLNIRTSGLPSPMIRHVLNPILEQNRRFPGKVNMTLYPRGKVILSGIAIQAESTHTFVRRLQSTDEAKVEQADRFREVFRGVSLDDYFREVRR